MDRSVDSIGSCSLDVDADSSEISDTSSSLNILTTRTTKDVAREFTSKIGERCPVKMGENSLVGTDSSKAISKEATIINQSTYGNTEFPMLEPAASHGKKPSYLNLACCVSGYSSITTYDSKIRQDINKSREVSPIRPSTASIQHCRKLNSSAQPGDVANPNDYIITNSTISTPSTGEPFSGAKFFETNNNYTHNKYAGVHKETVDNAMNNVADNKEDKKNTSFIQQRVESLYGPGAIVQGFYSPRKVRVNFEDRLESAEAKELVRKFQQVSSTKDFTEFSKQFNTNTVTFATNSTKPKAGMLNANTNNTIDLPVLRHLSQEFRAQLPSISPNRNYLRNLSMKQTESNPSSNAGETFNSLIMSDPVVNDEVDHVASEHINVDIPPNLQKPENRAFDKAEFTDVSYMSEDGPMCSINISNKKDGNYFLTVLKKEQNRILEMATKAEKYIDMLLNKEEVSEDILGVLRSASGKARLLVSQKMKQFEGLCHNNLNRSPEDKFPTTIEDLQGFWDMVYLQVDNINSIFDEIEMLKNNEWKKRVEESAPEISDKLKQQKLIKNANFKPNQKAVTEINKSKSTVMTASTLRREAQRKQLMETKRKHKMAMAMARSSSPLTDELKPSNIKTDEILVNANFS